MPSPKAFPDAGTHADSGASPSRAEGMGDGLIDALVAHAGDPGFVLTTMTDTDAALLQARRTLEFLYAARDCFPVMRELADHPGWEMALLLFIADTEGREINTSDLCALTGTWRPLAVRYIEMMFERGIVDREVTAGTPDTWTVRLTPFARQRMQELLCNFGRTIAAGEGGAVAN
jgi:hypothetical protein